MGPQGPSGPQGDRGEAGSTGLPGKTGARGNKWYYGGGDPTTNPPTVRNGGFNVGDMYFNITGCGIYAYESAAWGASPIVTLSGCS